MKCSVFAFLAIAACGGSDQASPVFVSPADAECGDASAVTTDTAAADSNDAAAPFKGYEPNCPPDAHLRGDAPPEGFHLWCETDTGTKSGWESSWWWPGDEKSESMYYWRGLLDGPARGTNANGNSWERWFRFGRKYGPERTWNGSTGHIVYQAYFEDDVPCGTQRTFSPEGQDTGSSEYPPCSADVESYDLKWEPRDPDAHP